MAGDERDETTDLITNEPGPTNDLDDFDDARRVARQTWGQVASADGYLPVLLLLFAALIAVPLIGGTSLGLFLSVVVIFGAVTLTVFRSTRRPRIRRVTMILIAVSAAAATGTAFGPDLFDVSRRTTSIVVDAILLVLLVSAFPLVLIRSFRQRRVTFNTLCASLSAYLLIALQFATLYRLLQLIGPPFFQQTATPTPGQFSYFSVVTMTTLGFGDLTPASDQGRAFVMVEALIGQVFLVTTMARVVSLLGQERPR